MSILDNVKFKYGPGIQQNYKYIVDIRTLFNGTSKNESTVYVEGTVNLRFLTRCDAVLTLSDITLNEKSLSGLKNSAHPNSQQFADAVTENSLRFSFKDGLIAELCPSVDEPVWVLNFKRGILSLLHNSMKRFDLDHSGEEEDVQGKCFTEYKVLGANGTGLLVSKYKNLNLCQRRSKLHSILQTTTTGNFNRNKKNDNILKSSSHCHLVIDHNIYNEISCEETHVFQPFSNQNSGVTTVVQQKLSLISEDMIEVMAEEPEVSRRAILGFDNVLPSKVTHGELKSSRDLLKKLCRSQDVYHDGLSELFSKFIQSLRLISYPAMSALYGHSKTTCPMARKILLDVMPFINTAASVSIMRDIILKETVPENIASEWLFSIAFIASPDRDVVTAAASLLQENKFSQTITLSVASLVHTFCMVQDNCNNSEAVISVVNYLESRLLEALQIGNLDREKYDEIMVLLKALSNIGIISDNLQNELFKIIRDNNIDTALRIAAVETFRRFSCENTRNYFVEIFRNQEVDAEVRIASYIQIMRCPNYLLIRTIRHSLLHEEVNQVGSFIWTHLNNLLKTSVPTKVEIQSLLSEKDLVKKFSSDIRKYSHNFEGSLYFDDYNLGSSYDSNVIFSTSSYVPRSVMFNFTVDMFGESLNIFEINSRLEGFEHYLESLFGPKGSSNIMPNSIIKSIRQTRDIQSDEALKNEMDQLPNFFKNVTKDPKVTLGLKIFGNEVKYSSFRGKEEIWSAITTLNPIHHLKNVFSEKEISYKKSHVLLDCNYIVPTTAGVPILLTALGTSSVNVKLFGSLKTGGFSKNRELELDLTADIQPTVSLDISGEMSVDAFYASTGAKIKANIYTDTAIKTIVKVRDKKLVSIKFSLPRQKNEIFSVRSELLLKKNNNEEKQSGISKRSIFSSACSWPIVERTIGLKLCVAYNFVNTTSIPNATNYLLAGPTEFRWYINKSDPTANVYLFEYKRTQRKDLSVISLTFDTPGSEVKRVLNANLTVDKQSHNLTMLLQSPEGEMLARGKYKNTYDEKFIQIALDVNRKKHFDASFSLTKHDIKNGYTYRPIAYLVVNGERVMKLEGSIDSMSKRGISQYTVDLKFETKRLNSKLFGYISKSESSLEVNMYQDYKFQNAKEQRIVLKFGVANRSRNNMVIVVGFCNLTCTAYPYLNFVSNATFQRSGGHMDLAIKLNQSPTSQSSNLEKENLEFDLLFSYKAFTDNKRTLRLVAALNKESSDIHLKGEFTYEHFLYDINIAALVKYGDNKDVSVTMFWSHPRSTMEQIKTHINVTIPSFTPMIFNLDIEEKHPKYYQIDLKATWFSGHSITALGFYQDKSVASSLNHHIKLSLNSPSFQNINADLQFYRDNNVLKLDLKALHDNDDYQIFFHYQTVTLEETRMLINIKYKEKLYKFLNTIYDGPYKRIHAELHIDQIRDIDFSAWIYSQNVQKALGFEINWDANRDPNQKLMISANYTRLADFNYITNFILSYPSRTIIGDHRLFVQGRNISTLASVSWNDGDTFAIDLNIRYENEQKLFVDLSSKLRTPFDHWKMTRIEGMFEHMNNKYSLNGLVAWDEGERVALNIFGDYTADKSVFSCKYSCSLLSSLSHIPSINTTISHTHNETNFNTILHLMYNPDFIIDLDSQWAIESNQDSTNLTGTVHSLTPFMGLNEGLLVSKILIKNNFVKGIAQIDLDNRKMLVNLEGNFKRITDCMLTVNATTATEKHQLRFRISTEDRHFVALFNYPTGSLGTEILLSVNNLTNFDVKLFVATPIDFLQKITVIGKLKPDQADFRLGWNFLLIGFSGTWKYVNITNLDYSCVIYTPIQDFEENGIVGRLILKEGLDLEFSVKLSTYKLGVKLLGQPKPKPIKELDMKIRNIYLKSKVSEPVESDNDELLSWTGLMELDVIIYPTMKGELEIDQKGKLYIFQSNLVMPYGIVTLYDEFEYNNILLMNNYMKITTPFSNFKNVLSNFNVDVEAKNKYIFSFNIDYENRTDLIKTGIYAKYLAEKTKDDNRKYNVTLKVVTPFKLFPKLNLFGGFKTEPNFYHAMLLFKTNRSDILIDATTKIINDLLEVNSRFNVITPSIHIPPCQAKIRKLFSHSNNYLEVNVNVPERLRSAIFFRTSWLIKSQTEFRSALQLETPFIGLENTTAELGVLISNEKSKLLLAIQINPIDMEIHSTLRNNLLEATSLLNFNGKRFPVSLNCTILQLPNDGREFNGSLLLKEKLFKISGNADVTNHLPTRISLKFTPRDHTSPLSFEYRLTFVSTNKYKITGSVQHSKKYTLFNILLSVADRFNWDSDLQVDTSNGTQINAHVKAYSSGNSKNIFINAQTPILKLEEPKLGATYTVSGLQHSLHGFFDLENAKGNIDADLIWAFLENMYVKAIGRYENMNYSSQSSLEVFYKNPKKLFEYFRTGGDISIGKVWEAGTNITLILQNKIGFEGHFKLPDENTETHSIYGNLDYSKNVRNFHYLLKYRTALSLLRYGSWGKILTEDRKKLSGDIEVEWDSRRYNNYVNLNSSGKVFDFLYKLKTPTIPDKSFIVTEINFNSTNDNYNVTGEIFYPEGRSVAYTTVNYNELANMNGIFNVTVPYKSLNFTGVYYETKTDAMVYNRYIKVFWDGDNAILDNKCDIKEQMLDRTMKGLLTVELPLTTRHIAAIDYEYNKKAEVDVGHAIVYYNGTNIVESLYKRVTVSEHGLNKDKIHLELQNNKIPLGVDYIHKQEYHSQGDKYGEATVDNKYLHLYNLRNHSKFNLTGEVYVRTSQTGQEYILMTTHANRTIKLWNDYDVFNREYKQHSRLELSPSAWIEYDLTLNNKTMDTIFDVQHALINVFYPRRNFTAQGFYNISDSIVSSEITLMWDEDKKTVQMGMDWRRTSRNRKQLLFEIKHPSFEKNVSVLSEYGYKKSFVDGFIEVDYSVDANKKLTFGGKLSDNCNSQIYNYSYTIWAEHNATNLNLNSRGDFYWSSQNLGTEHVTNYQRSYLPLSTSEALAKINFDQNKIELKRDSVATGLSHFYGQYGGKFPVYSANISSINGVNDTSGEFYINFRKKILYSNVNMTADGSQSLHMYAFIPNARSAMFDVWRDYEDKRVSDVSYYLRLNHSRLIMSTLRWRPELISDVQMGVRRNIMQIYLSALESINHTRQYIRTETSEAVHGVWIDAKTNINSFLSDLKNLSVIEGDIEQLRLFLNKSYYNNEFYIKDITTVVMTMFDELALKSHLQSLPKIVQEVWSVMGDSGQKIKKGILWVIDKVKLYYKNATDFIHGLIEGDPVEHITKVFEKLIEKYDNFIKNVHVSFIQYIEKLWSQTYALILEHWHKTLSTIEPTFLKFIHYLESIVWSTGKEFLDFLYLRKNEIIESPYFVKFTKFSQDLDKFYKDISGKNTIAVLYKYITITWNFLKEKYLNSIPFGKELSAIVNEIWTEVKRVGNIPFIKFLTDRWNETYESLKYYCDYFDVENKIHKFISVVYLKLSDMSLTALQAENRQRIPKTNFIFEPSDGIMSLEQKLPMPWHAFNETPKFKEIPEIKAIFDLQNYIESSKLSFWNLYYDYKPYTDISGWLPPFKGQAMLIGTKHYITFDRKFYSFQGSCTYLLATDFVDRNFTLLATYNSEGRVAELILQLNRTLIHINVPNKSLHSDGSGMERLPTQIGDSYIHQHSDILIVGSSSGFTLECNLKFHICVFEMSGWYFGKTAGLLGTYNNEPSDDFTTRYKSRLNITDINTFGESWHVNNTCEMTTSIADHTSVHTVPKNIINLCSEFFASKVSQLNTCFPKIPKESFMNMCLSSTNEKDACISAVSYMNLCSYANVPLRIPDTCVTCDLLNGTRIKEGEFVRLQGSEVPRSVDVVFIIEAKECNKDITKSKNFGNVAELLDKELTELKLTQNRYAVVVFGGDGVFDEPRNMIIDGNVFTTSKFVSHYLNNLPTGNGNKDIFNAIIFAYNLIFRPGVSRCFILLPCSECNKYYMEHDYSTVHQLLSEGAVTLNVIMNDYFTMQKEREVKTLFGIDKRYVYTKRDTKEFIRDQVLRKSIILPKSTLGPCLSLILETNGTVFSGKYLETDKKTSKKMSTVFAKAVGQKLLPRQCVDCECTAPNTGISYMDCYQCTMTNLSRSAIEHVLGSEDDDTLLL